MFRSSVVASRLRNLLVVQGITLAVTLVALSVLDPPQAFAPIVWALIIVEMGLIVYTARTHSELPPVLREGSPGGKRGPLEASPPECRILLIGLGRSGKTSIIRQVLTGSNRREASTTDFAMYRARRVSDLDGAPFDLVLADYQGQKFSQLVIDRPQRFFGPRGAREINALIFVVDLFRELRDANGDAVSDYVLLEHYSQNTDAQIRERVDEQCRYINEFALEVILETTFSRKSMCSIFLVVNKIDLLRALVDRGCIPGVVPSALQRYVSELYAPLNGLIKEAARANGVVESFGAYLISARTGENLATVFSEIIRRYQDSVAGVAARGASERGMYG